MLIEGHVIVAPGVAAAFSATLPKFPTHHDIIAKLVSLKDRNASPKLFMLAASLDGRVIFLPVVALRRFRSSIR
jgi:hypothetical protein